jgi:hypothetical protein
MTFGPISIERSAMRRKRGKGARTVRLGVAPTAHSECVHTVRFRTTLKQPRDIFFEAIHMVQLEFSRLRRSFAETR